MTKVCFCAKNEKDRVIVMEELKENQQRLIEFMEIGDYITLKKELNEENPANIAELFEELSGEKQLFLFRLLTKDAAAEAFSYMDSDMQEHIVQSITYN